MFVHLIFVVVSLRRKFFHAELFPNYGSSWLESVHGENDVTLHAPGNDFNGGCIAK